MLEHLDDNHFIKRLEEGKDTGLMLVAHNAYWSQFRILERRYSNFRAYIFGGIVHTHLRKEDIPKDCDFILLDGYDFFSEDNMDEIKRIAEKIS